MLTTVASSDCIRYDLSPEVMAFTTTRSIARNKTAISALTGIPEQHIVIPHQVHSDGVAIVDDTFLALAADQQTALLDGIDAVITPNTNVCIGVSTADCVPIILYDPRQRVAAAVHAGWRGTRLRVVKKVINIMLNEFHCDAKTLVAVIGPCICRHCFEVGPEVYDAFYEAHFDMSAIAARYPAGQTGLPAAGGADMRDTKWHLDLRACNKQQLTACGIPVNNIAIAPQCTYETPSLLFSARREQHGTTKCGRNYTAIILHNTQP